MLSFILFIRILLASSNAFTNAQTALGPLVVIALMFDALVVTIWYFVGSLLNNGRIKGAALGEFNQFIGTCILVGILLGGLTTISSLFYTAVSSTTLMSPTAISTMCTNIESSSQLDLLGNANSFLAGPTSSSGNFPGLCNFVSSGSISSLTDKLNYPLAAAGVVVANLTNQTVTNLNYTFTIDAWLSFLAQLRPTIALCIQLPPTEPCVIPGTGEPAFDLQYSSAGDAGYSLLTSNLTIIGSLLNLSVESFIVQIIFIAIFLYIWPWLIFGGIILRSTMFTRRLGGLLLAIAIVGLFIYPTIFAIEYLSLGNGLTIPATSTSGSTTNSIYGTSLCNSNTIGYNSVYGYCATTQLPSTNSLSNPAGYVTGNYVVNFFVEPNIKAISWGYSCWPNILGAKTGTFPALPFTSLNGLLGAEAIDIGQLTIPGISLISSLVGVVHQFTTGNPSLVLAVNCKPQAALNTFFGILDAYGIIGIVSYLLPLINIIITISSIVGLSSLFGGDTELAGIAKIL